MKIFNNSQSLKEHLRKYKEINFVPTMGNLHSGHMSLISRAEQDSGITVVSIFVNDLQFGPNEDLHSYPRTQKEDLFKLEQIGVDAVFIPTSENIYPDGSENHTKVKVPTLSKKHCGISRPIFFEGITTVIVKLFNIIKPTRAYFGEKDWQQFVIIKKLCSDLAMDVEIYSLPIIREKNGLALSSRNNYLSEDQISIAGELFKSLNILANAYKNSTYESTLREVKNNLVKKKFTIDYINLIDENTLEYPNPCSTKLRILAAVYFEKIRLIDNISI
ncbi:MAG: pantoate--beta-alanine ligase [Pseudomonadota bacterium]|nr:pantoate--beta-alanine ligase [Pseudomonadota bacterium]